MPVVGLTSGAGSNLRKIIEHGRRTGVYEVKVIFSDRADSQAIVVDKSRAKLIRKTFEVYATGKYPFAQIRKIINTCSRIKSIT